MRALAPEQAQLIGGAPEALTDYNIALRCGRLPQIPHTGCKQLRPILRRLLVKPGGFKGRIGAKAGDRRYHIADQRCRCGLPLGCRAGWHLARWSSRAVAQAGRQRSTWGRRQVQVTEVTQHIAREKHHAATSPASTSRRPSAGPSFASVSEEGCGCCHRCARLSCTEADVHHAFSTS